MTSGTEDLKDQNLFDIENFAMKVGILSLALKIHLSLS